MKPGQASDTGSFCYRVQPGEEEGPTQGSQNTWRHLKRGSGFRVWWEVTGGQTWVGEGLEGRKDYGPKVFYVISKEFLEDSTLQSDR